MEIKAVVGVVFSAIAGVIVGTGAGVLLLKLAALCLNNARNILAKRRDV